jgi:hypothetical protein
MRIPILVLALATGCSGGEALTAPRIESVSGAVLNREILTLHGRGFGVKPVAPPYRWDDFDGGRPGKRLADEAHGGWYTYSFEPGKWPVYSTARVRSAGSQSACQDFTGGNYNSTIALTDLPDSPLYFSGWFYITTSGAPSRNVKLIQMRPGELLDPSWECRLDQYPSTNSGHQYVSDCDNQPLAVPVNDYRVGGDLLTDGWHRLESWIDQGTPNGKDGIWTLWLDGRVWTEVSGTFMTQGDCPFHRLWLGFYYATDVGTPQPQALRYWDELYVDFSRMRVEIGNAPTWAACTHREIQVPQTWADGAITIRVNQGSFPAGATAYIYTVNEKGEPDAQGIPVVFAGGP